MKIRVLTYNIHKGWSIGNRRFVLENLRDTIRQTQANIVYLQEVIGSGIKKGSTLEDNSAQFEFLADSVWSHYAYGKNAVYSQGHHGNAILSQFPFIQTENLDVSTNRFERRGLLHGVIQDVESKKKLHLICVHLNLMERGRKKQIEALCERIESSVPRSEPLIIAGDSNDWRGRVSQELLDRLSVVEAYQFIHGKHARTFPSFLPLMSLDRIYCRGVSIHDVERLVSPGWRNLSDHLPLMAELDW